MVKKLKVRDLSLNSGVYWSITISVFLVILVGVCALTVWLSKLYDTTPTITKNYGSASPFPDVAPIVSPPPVDPVTDMCFKWCAFSGGTFEPCAAQLQKCNNSTNGTCDLCSSNQPGVEITCQSVSTYFNDPEQQAQANKAYGPNGYACLPNKKSCLNPNALVKCNTSQDCGVCSETPTDLNGAAMACEYVSEGSNINLQGSDVDNVPGGWYCLPERKACNMQAGRAVWTDQGWSCDCLWPTIMAGPACNTLVACSNEETSGAQVGQTPGAEDPSNSSTMQNLYVNCPTTEACGNLGKGPLESRVWNPASTIDPLACYCPGTDPSIAVTCGNATACVGGIEPIPTTVCRCDGRQASTNQNFTYSDTNRHACVIDRCNVGAWGRKLPGDTAYFSNATPKVLFSLQVANPLVCLSDGTCFLFIDTPQGSPPLAGLTTSSDYKFEMMGDYLDSDDTISTVIPGAWRQWQYNKASSRWFNTGLILYINNDGITVGGMPVTGGSLQGQRYRFIMDINEGATANNPSTPYNAIFTLYSPIYNSGSFPADIPYIQYTDKSWNNNNRYLAFDPTSKAVVLGSNVVNGGANPNLLLLERTGWTSVQTNDSSVGTDYLPQPFNTCACSGQDSQTWFQSCVPSPGASNIGNLALLNSHLMRCDLLQRAAFSHLCQGVTTQTCSEVQQLCLKKATTSEDMDTCAADFTTCSEKLQTCTTESQKSAVYTDMCNSDNTSCLASAKTVAAKSACATTLATCLGEFDKCQQTKAALKLCDKTTNPQAQLVWEYQATCNPNGYVIPGSVLTVPGAPDSEFCQSVNDFYPNMQPSASNMVPGLAQQAGGKTVHACSADPCTGSYSDPLFNNTSGGGNWDPRLGQCDCICRYDSDSTQPPGDCFRNFSVDTLNKTFAQSDTVKKCDHIENPVCAVCQNACQGILLSSLCHTLPGYECPPVPSNMSCTTNLKGEPQCVCGGECVSAEPEGSTQAQGVCIKKIGPGESCNDFKEGSTQVCENPDGNKCTGVEGYYSSLETCLVPGGYGTTYPCQQCVKTNPNQWFRQCLPNNSSIDTCVVKSIDDGSGKCGQIGTDIYYCPAVSGPAPS